VLGGMAIGTVSGLAAPPAIALLRRRLRWRAFVVPHTHWDREWYEQFEVYRARLVVMVSRLLDLLERDGEFRSFTFDGQTIAIQDHLEKRPEDRPRVEALVRADRLLIGPWHVLADLLLVSGESILRNLQEGLRSAGELGRASRVAYVADPFGHPAQLPQILRGFGYRTYVFSRGVGDEGEELGSEFRWEAPSGDRVVASHQVAHYNNALPLVAQAGRPVDDVTRQVRRVLPVPRGVFVGEMVAGKYRPILRGVNSTRVWIKQENAAGERLLLERCEPLDALAGGTEAESLRALWRILLENQPHDSICGCSI